MIISRFKDKGIGTSASRNVHRIALLAQDPDLSNLGGLSRPHAGHNPHIKANVARELSREQKGPSASKETVLSTPRP